jgi:hypothetical protein
MAAIKTTWGKPEMTVLVRDRLEEAVLAACKFGDLRLGPNAGKVNCNFTNCGQDCSTFLTS